MRVEEIALRQDIRQMMNEAGLNKNTIREMAQKLLEEEVKKQVKTAFAQNNIERIVTRNISKWDLREAVKEVVRDYVKSDIKVSVKIEEGVSE